MSLRRAGTLVVALALTACQNVTQDAQPSDLVFASYNSATGAIPLPNDLLLQLYTAPTAAPSATISQAQIEVLRGYARSGGFPSDVEAAITIPFNSLTWNGTAYVAGTPPTLDAGTVDAQRVLLLRWDTSAAGTTSAAAPEVVAYDAELSPGKLTLRPKAAADSSRRWKGGRYVVAVRGGPSGVKTTAGAPVNPDSGIALAVQNKDMTIKENQPPGFTAAQAAQVNGLRAALWNAFDWQANGSGGWSPVPSTQVAAAFTAIDASPAHPAYGFPYAEAAVVATFGIDKSAHVALDASAGQVPFPSDFLFERNPANCPTGVAPCIVNNPAAFGPAAAGLRTLDGFSTTALLLAPLTGAVQAASITRQNVHLFELPAAGAPVWVKDLASTLTTPTPGVGANYVTQPPGTSAGGFATTMVLAPAALADLGTLGRYALPPLKERTRYAVVVTRRVLSADGTPMARGAVANILLSTAAPLAGPGPGGTNISYVQGADYATALGLQQLRDGLAPFLAALPALTSNLTTKDDVAMVYTVTTQSVTGTSLSLSAAPYSIEAGAGQAIFAGTGITPITPPAGTPTAGVSGFFSVPFNSADITDKATGALRPTLATDLATPATVPTLLTSLHALVAVPDAASVPLCGAGFPAGARCAKLVIIGHGVLGDKDTVYPLASALASQGFLVAGIDFPLHGERNWCSADGQCTTDGVAGDGTCDKTGAFAGGRAIADFSLSAGQGDCGALDPASAACLARRPGICANGSVPLKAASRYTITSNFFRVRDAFRQYLFDVSALTLALSRPPGTPVPAGDPLAAVLPAGVIVDPSAIYYEGISWGSINGASVLATHPRITRAALSVGGGTLVDALVTSPTYRPGFDQLLPSLIAGYTPAAVTPGNPAFDAAVFAKFTQLLQLAKWILDPADPVNYAQKLRTSPMPNLLANPNGSVAQAPKDVFAQIALGDTSVPNPTNYLLDLLIDGEITLYTDDDPAGGPAPHDMIARNAQVQLDAALFLVDPVNNVPPAARAVTFP
jgi:hypothetical protein